MRLALAIGIAYLLAAWLSLALLTEPENIAIFWPASGIATGTLLTLGHGARLPVSAGVVIATIAVNWMAGRSLGSTLSFSLCNAGEVLLSAELIERWCGPTLRLDDVRRVLGLLLGAAVGPAVAAFMAALALRLSGHTTAPLLDVWRVWFASHSLGIVAVAPLIIGWASVRREQVPQRELFEGAAALLAIVALTAFVFAAPAGHWTRIVPEALLFPLVLWAAARCRPVFAAAAILLVAVAAMAMLTYNIGRLGDLSVAHSDRVLAAQVGLLAATLSALLIAALFSERRQNEAALGASEARLRSILDAANVVAWEVDLVRDTVHATGPARYFLKKEPGSQPITMATSAEEVHPADRERVKAEFAAALEGKAPYRTEFRLASENGGVRWVASEGTVERAKDGQPLRVLGVSHDITESKRTEAALQDSHRVLDSVIENLPAMVFMKRASDLRFVRLNRAGEKLLGYSRDELLGKNDYDFFPKAQADAFTRIDRAVLAGNEVREIAEEPVRTRDGATRYLKTSKIVLRNADRTPTHVLGVSIDITERRESEEHVRLLMREISHRAKNLLSVVQVMARHTARDVDPEVFVDRFSERLAGLAASHDLLVKSDWRGIHIADLISSQLAHFSDLVGRRVLLDGPLLRLRPSAAQTIGMALHELGTNAAKYGALSSAEGIIEIEWGVIGTGKNARVRIRWSEHGGPPREPSQKGGFGHTVIVDMVKQALDAEVRLEYRASGAVWELIAPAEWTLDPPANSHAR